MLWVQGHVFQAEGNPDAKALEVGVCLACSKNLARHGGSSLQSQHLHGEGGRFRSSGTSFT